MIPHKPKYEFHSVFAASIRDYLEIKDALGVKTTVLGNTLRQFDRYCLSIGLEDANLTTELVENWLLTKAGEKHGTRSSRISVLWCFARIFLLLVEKSRGDHLPDMRDAKKDMYHIFIQKKR